MKIHKCVECKRILQKSVFDNCMFCGAAIPHNKRLTAKEKSFLTARKKLLNDRHERAISDTPYQRDFKANTGWTW